jgi:methionyl-tRNA formyltransferase
MRVAFIGKSHPFSLLPFAAMRERFDVVALVESGPRGRLTRSAHVRRRLQSVASALRPQSMRGWALRHRVPYFYLDHGSRQRLEGFLHHCRPDVLAIASLSFILPESTLAIAKHGAINLHPSLLPHYHGPFPWLWQYIDDVRQIGVTVHKLDSGQDTGPIAKQIALDLPRGLDVADAQEMAGRRGAALMCDVIEEIAAGSLQLSPQSLAGLPKARVVSRDEPLIDWVDWPLERAWHALRGTYPWLDPRACPPAMQQGRYRVLEYDSGAAGGEPGHVCTDGSGCYVAHAQGKIRICPAPTP